MKEKEVQIYPTACLYIA